MRYSITPTTSKLPPSNSASFVDQMIIDSKNGFSSKKQSEYIILKDEFYSSTEKPFEQIRKETQVRLGGSYRTNKNIVVVTR